MDAKPEKESSTEMGPTNDAAASESSPAPGRWTIAASVTLLGSLIAILLPVMQAIQAHRDEVLKREDDNQQIALAQKDNDEKIALAQKDGEQKIALAQKDLEQKITMEFLQLAVSKDTAPVDRLHVLQAILTLNTPLTAWAKAQIREADKDIALTNASTRNLVETASKMKSNPELAAYYAALASIQITFEQLTLADKNHDLASIPTLQQKYVDDQTRANQLYPQVAQELATGAPNTVGPPSSAATTLNKVEASELKPIDISAVTATIVSRMFPSTPSANIRQNLPSVLNALQQANLLDRTMVLMALSTIRAEDESFLPNSEGRSIFNTSPGGTPFDLYDNRKDLGNQGPPDGANFRGRGYIRLTGRANYLRYSTEIGQNLVTTPELANDPTIAAELLARFLADRESALRAALATGDLATARRLVNGGSNGLDRFVSAYHIGDDLLPM